MTLSKKWMLTYTSMKALSFSGLLISTTATYSCGKETLKYWYWYAVCDMFA